jgi:hypothetical protein
LPPERIQTAIDDFYAWLEQLVAEGKMKPGHRLGNIGKTVARGSVLDGPYGETKEAVGGYWFILAESLEAAAAIASDNPCMQCGLFYEIRPLEFEKASAFKAATETPDHRRWETSA